MNFERIFNIQRTEVHRDRGATLVEYALIVGLIAIVSVVGIGAVGASLNRTLDDTATSLAYDGSGSTSGTPDGDEVTTTTAAPSDDADGPDGSSGDGSGLEGGSGPSTTTTTAPVVDDDDVTGGFEHGDDDGKGDDGKDDDDDAPLQTATAEVPGQLSVTFVVIDDEVTIAGIKAWGWDYEIKKQKDHQIQLEFFDKYSKGRVQVKGWLTGSGKLKTSVTEKGGKR